MTEKTELKGKLIFIISKVLSVFLLLTISACSQTEDPAAQPPIFLRGSFNSWGTDIQFVSNNNEYLAQSSFNEGTIEFKIADPEWGKINLGLPETQTIELDKEVSLISGGSNIYFYVDSDMTNLVFVLKKDQGLNYTLTVVKGSLQFVK